MELKQLNYFVAVADEGSVSAAARKLYMSQPPLSAQMQNLERELGCVLFERGSRRITLTDAGSRLYARAKTILEMSRVAEEEARLGSKDVLRIGVVSSVAASVGVPWLHGFSRAHPEIRFEITESNTYRLIENLRAHIISLAIIRTPFTAEDMVCETLMCESLAAVGRQEFFGETDPRVFTPQVLSQKPLIVYRRWKSVVEQLCAAAETEAMIRFLCDDARTAYALAKAGAGIAVLPESGVRGVCAESVEIRPIAGQGAESKIMLVWQRMQPLGASAMAFAQYIRETFEGK